MNRPKCQQCQKYLRRKSQIFLGQSEPYKGNLYCYRQKQNKFNKSYSYVVWDGESYKLHMGANFCGTKCASKWAVARNQINQQKKAV